MSDSGMAEEVPSSPEVEERREQGDEQEGACKMHSSSCDWKPDSV